MKTSRLLAVVCGLLLSVAAFAQTRIIAHRGYWKTAGSAQNSLTALVAAHNIDAYGSEFDVSITTDGKIMVNHDPTIQGISIENNPYWVIMDKRLDNCETVPTLNQYLAMARYLAPTKLILEIKPHDQEANEDRCVDEVLRLVKAAGLESRTEYISFSYHVCKRLALKAPGAMVSYLGGDKTPAEVHADGIKGIDYDGKIIMKNPRWVEEAHRLGMTVNVWTIDDPDDIKAFVKMKVDFITTNIPVEAMKLCR